MAGYFGTETQQRLQARAEAAAAFIEATPGACQTGRTMGCDDPAKLGWERIDEYLDRDGICGFRLISADGVAELEDRLGERGYRLDTWDVFLADRSTALLASKGILSRSLPAGLFELESPTDPTGERTQRIQSIMSAAGVAPFSGSMLVGAIGPATTTAIGDADGNVVAVAHGYMPHNSHSDFHRYAWGGLVAVADTLRGKGLGNYVNALMISRVFERLTATHIYELVSATNAASRRMVEACGLRLQSGLVCGIATPTQGSRFTR
ncbi:GNAT family N-acetyltransferase [Aquibium oceanicum]|uniref:N-acetyltransferase domain-containing protein n=1 Tax=Aquibium oceanicum TaxID=1670800 RepID=A0A1L3SL56_9HYPH|nr:GNAT family protein [Aquibium oceanicum]APH70075.1 hypothetical protein BSQ44_00785 [Aquibium oceanicum]